MKLTEQKNCVVCNAEVVTGLDLGEHPIANQLLQNKKQKYKSFPLGLSYCSKCSHSQVTHFLSPKDIFSDYLYASGTSNTLQNYFEWFADKMLCEFNAGINVLEIASNDGSLLDKLANARFSVCGIDPAENLCNIAKTHGHHVVCDFYPSKNLVDKFELIVAMNVLAHNPKPVDFIKGVANNLSPNGTAIIQTSQALMLNEGEFDTIYHEHYSFFTIQSMQTLANRAGLALIKTELVTVHGISFLFYLQHKNAKPIPQIDFADKAFSANQHLTELPFTNKNENIENSYSSFVDKALNRIKEVNLVVDRYKQENYKIALVGVAAKSLTFMWSADLKYDGCFDESEHKIDTFIPGYSQPIKSFYEICNLDKVLVVIGAWNFADEISKKVIATNPTTEIKFLTYFPTMREF